MAPAQVVEAKDLPPELMASEVARGAPAPMAAAEPATGGITPLVGGQAFADTASTAVPSHPGAAHESLAPPGSAAPPLVGSDRRWLVDLEREARRLLESGDVEVWDTLTRQFEGQLIHTALEITRGRRIEAAHKLGIGRNTITRKIQELGLDD